MTPEAYRNRAKGGHGAEADACARLGGVLTKGSGNGARKGDFYVKGEMFEVKSTKSKSFIIKYEWLTKVQNEATAAGMNPRLSFVFSDKITNRPLHQGAWVAMPETQYLDLMEKLNG